MLRIFRPVRHAAQQHRVSVVRHLQCSLAYINRDIASVASSHRLSRHVAVLLVLPTWIKEKLSSKSLAVSINHRYSTPYNIHNT